LHYRLEEIDPIRERWEGFTDTRSGKRGAGAANSSTGERLVFRWKRGTGRIYEVERSSAQRVIGDYPARGLGRLVEVISRFLETRGVL